MYSAILWDMKGKNYGINYEIYFTKNEGDIFVKLAFIQKDCVI